MISDNYNSRLTTIKIPGSHELNVRLSKLLDTEVWMVTDREVRRLMELLGKGMSLTSAAAKADMAPMNGRYSIGT